MKRRILAEAREQESLLAEDQADIEQAILLAYLEANPDLTEADIALEITAMDSSLTNSGGYVWLGWR